MSGCASVPERGCGYRVENGCYWETGLSSAGSPLEDFLFDPPLLVPQDVLESLPRVGVTLYARRGVWHLLDWVGEDYYPNVADMIEEIRRFGLSRRLPSNLDFEKLTPESRIILVHARAWIDNHADYGTFPCPQQRKEHLARPLSYGCAGIWWRDVSGGEPLDDPAYLRAVQRSMPSFSYHAYHAPPGVTPQVAPAFFARFPASRLVVVRGDRSAALAVQMQRSSLPVEEVDS